MSGHNVLRFICQCSLPFSLNVAYEDLSVCTAKLVQVVAGIKKLQIMMTIVDDEVSVDNLIEDYLTSEPNNEYIQSCDIVAFNKICEFQPFLSNMDLSSRLI